MWQTNWMGVRSSAKELLESVGVTRIVVVDDEYADRVEELIGICAAIGGAEAAGLPHLGTIEFTAPPEVWTVQVKAKWGELDREDRRGSGVGRSAAAIVRERRDR